MWQMRVVEVSAHYPPNFISGGTLVPHRIARGLARRGHEVHVYAGHLDDSRPPLSTWEETDEAGVRVRWISTTPWTAWGDDRNWANPDVEADFRAWLAQVRPDVVHLHSLQTLGGSLVRAAKESGAATVVTMHDFWWFCARQFLVDREGRPCTLVADCSTCECQRDQTWKVARIEALARELDAADLVLAPSRSAARVFVANGVDPDRLEVDENGVPDVAGPAPEADGAGGDAGPGAGVRLMFAGGTDPMKGLSVLLAAVRRLPTDVPWSLDLYGVPSPEPGLPAQVRRHAAYAPEDLAAVLAAHDVLVLPSVMRESHSILTREALRAGLAVVCTDTLGPEEAVDHGRNGLVVPAGDAAALAAALTRLVRDPAEVAALRGQGSAAPLREVDDQVAGLEERYARLVAKARAAGPAARGAAAGAAPGGREPLRSVLFVVGINGAPLRYRVHLAVEALAADGVAAEVRHYRDASIADLAMRADAVVVYRVPATTEVDAVVRRLKAERPHVPVVFDVDDLIFDPTLRGSVPGLRSLTPEAEELWWRGVARYRTTMEMADLFVGSTAPLCAEAARVTGLPTRQFRNGVGRAVITVSDRHLARPRRRGPLRIGYFSGTTTHDADWAMVEPAIVQVMQERPDVQLWLGGTLRTTAALDPVRRRVRRLPMMPWQSLLRTLRDVDVNLAPLVEGSVFNEAKSAIKWLEAAMVQTPTVASPTQPFVEAVEHGRTGYLASTTEEWVDAVGRLLDDELERVRIGTQARREALLTLSPHVQGRVYRQILEDARDLVAEGVERRTSTWEPVLDSEPFSPAASGWVDPYGVRVPLTWRRVPGLKQAVLVVTVFRAAGARGVAQKTGEVLRRVARRAR
jgi:glycosyltransferase involved in cell wall biosynthesis